MTPLLQEYVGELRTHMTCEAVGIRVLDDEGNIPYQCLVGFPREFYESESPLSIHKHQCICTKVIKGETHADLPFYTEGGSFYVNGTTRFLARLPEEQKRSTRNVCNEFGYESVGLFPIRAGGRLLGLIHIADHREDMIPPATVAFLEDLARQLGCAIERVRARDELRKAKDELEIGVRQRTSELAEANKQLLAEIGVRRQAEQELLAHQAQLRLLASELSLTEERERQQLATDLHDVVGQNLAIAKIKLGALKESSPSSEFKRQADEIRELIDEAIQTTRTMTFELGSPVLHELGLEAALERLVEEICPQHNIEPHFEDDGEPKPLDDDVRVLLFRTARELLLNVAKHARAGNAWVSVRRLDENIEIRVRDDGVGFDRGESHGRGFGLFSVRERLDHLGGHIDVESGTGCGTQITLAAPLRHETGR